ncbi:MAG: hypothetical protein AAFQ82_22430 [Myxococcota bacterium]
MEDYCYTRMYVDISVPRDALADLLEHALNAKPGSFATSFTEFQVRLNDSRVADNGDPDDFLNFPFVVDLATDIDFPEEHLELTGKAMQAIAKGKFRKSSGSPLSATLLSFKRTWNSVNDVAKLPGLAFKACSRRSASASRGTLMSTYIRV